MPAEAPGRGSSITDVPGVRVGHVTIADGEIQTGVTAVLPYADDVRHRKLFVGGFGGGGYREWTGSAVGEDFGTLSSPILLCNATTVGIAYDALLTRGYRRDPELPVDDAWPPIVIGIDDGHLNALRRRAVTHDDVLRAISEAKGGVPARGSVGVGRGLCALGGKGGVGCGSRAAQIGGESYVVGALLAANGGFEALAAPSFVAVIATDAPLFPEQLREVAEGSLRGLDALPLLSGGGRDARLAIAFSTGNPIEGSLEEAFRIYKARRIGQGRLGALLDAAASAVRAALRSALTEAEGVTGRKGRSVARLPAELLAKLPAE